MVQTAYGLMTFQYMPAEGSGHFPPDMLPRGHILPEHFTLPHNSFSLFTWRRTFPLPPYDPPVYNIKRSTIIVYKIDIAFRNIA